MVLWIIIGIFISCFDTSLNLNYVHVIIVNGMLILEWHIINEISKKEYKYTRIISALEIAENFRLNTQQVELGKILSSWYVKLISIVMGILYLYMMVSLEILKINTLIFLYGSITLISTVYFAIQLYIKYILYIYFIKKISDQDFKNSNYDRVLPNRTYWIVSTANFFNIFKFYFSVLGCIYTFEYLFTMKKEFLYFKDNHIVLNTPNDFIFIVSWIIIFVFIGLGYFIFSELIKYYLLKIVKKYENLALKRFSTFMNDSEISTIDPEQESEYVKYYKLYAQTTEIYCTEKNFSDNIFPYIPILLNIYKVLQSFL